MKEVTGLVSNIQRYSTKDGPGLRTTVFLTGCNLRCKWCANPESMYPGKKIFYHSDRCKRCGLCVAAANNNSIALGESGCIINRKVCLLKRAEIEEENIRWQSKKRLPPQHR